MRAWIHPSTHELEQCSDAPLPTAGKLLGDPSKDYDVSLEIADIEKQLRYEKECPSSADMARFNVRISHFSTRFATVDDVTKALASKPDASLFVIGVGAWFSKERYFEHHDVFATFEAMVTRLASESKVSSATHF